MSKYFILIIAVLIPFISSADPADLIDFDDPANQRYFKSHTIISAELDKEFNFRQEGSNSSVYCLNDVESNFSSDRVEKFFLKIKYENWIHGWMKNNQNLRLFFHINDNTGIPKLMGYSSKKLPINTTHSLRKSPIDLKDFTNVDVSSIESDQYIVGTISPDFDKIYPFVFKRAIVLGYPSDLKWRNIDSYVGTYKLAKPLSVPMIHAILNNKVHQLVLKKVGDKFEVCGFVRPAHMDMPVE